VLSLRPTQKDVLSPAMTINDLFRQHITHLRREFSSALAATTTPDSSVLIHSGSSHNYFADDHAPPFRAWGHFLRWIPVDRPDQFVLMRPDEKPVFIALIARDYWHDQHMDMPDWWAECFEVVILEKREELAGCLQRLQEKVSQLHFLGEDKTLAAALQIPPSAVNKSTLLHWLDYHRAYKTPYEIHRLTQANAHALRGHQAAHQAFLDGQDEFGIHLAYLNACRVLDDELPYSSIVALNKNAAILHYQHKVRRCAPPDPQANQVLLIDAGCRSAGYCSDITRTWTGPQAHPVFVDLLGAMQKMQQAVISAIQPGMSYVDLHSYAHQLLAQVLIDMGICRGSAHALLDHDVTAVFLPHGLGHLLGLQVHDSGGRMVSADGTVQPPPALFPALRTTRNIEHNMVFTIEPGVYFIPMLLDHLRQGEARKLVNWELVDELTPAGGIRIEDNIHVAADGIHNLTQQAAMNQLDTAGS
jgi:Xaa-Pro dipeptidase